MRENMPIILHIMYSRQAMDPHLPKYIAMRGRINTTSHWTTRREVKGLEVHKDKSSSTQGRSGGEYNKVRKTPTIIMGIISYHPCRRVIENCNLLIHGSYSIWNTKTITYCLLKKS